MLLIGSQALIQIGHGNLINRACSDTDLVATMDETRAMVATLRREGEIASVCPIAEGKKTVIRTKTLGIIEVEIAWSGTTSADLALLSDERGRILCGRFDVEMPSLNTLYALKMSHRYLKDSPHFLKTRGDIMAMRIAGARIPDHLREWYLRRVKETYNYSHPKLNQSKMGFFSGDAVPYRYDHDSIHVAMARGSVPAYVLYKKDGADVQVDRSKWDALPDETKLDSVVEESCVLALERSQIPASGVLTPEASFLLALKKVCTSITSGWWREYAWENYDLAVTHWAAHWSDYVPRLHAAVASGIVKPHVKQELEAT